MWCFPLQISRADISQKTIFNMASVSILNLLWRHPIVSENWLLLSWQCIKFSRRLVSYLLEYLNFRVSAFWLDSAFLKTRFDVLWAAWIHKIVLMSPRSSSASPILSNSAGTFVNLRVRTVPEYRGSFYYCHGNWIQKEFAERFFFTIGCTITIALQ